MRTQSATTIASVTRLAIIIDLRKQLDKEEKSLKAELKEIMGTEALLDAGEYCVLISGRNRKDLDKDAIMHDMGSEWVKKYSKTISYEIMEVRSTARNEVSNA